jgi:hypothetical protein
MDQLLETYWRWDKHFRNGCEKFCPVDADGGHFGYKDHYSSDDTEPEPAPEPEKTTSSSIVG